MKRILILTADFGFGHRVAANAISSALADLHGADCLVDIVNPLEDPRSPSFLHEDQGSYDRLVRELPELYKLGYQVSETRIARRLLRTTWTLMLFTILRELIRKNQPDIITSTYPFYAGILSAIFAVERTHVPLLIVVTDLATVNRLWFHTAADLCLVPTQVVYNLAIEAGLSPEKVKITGIPIRPELVKEDREKSLLRSDLGWTQDLFTMLAIGSKRIVHLYDSLRVLNHSGLPLQLAVVAGGNDELYQRLQETEWHMPIHLYNYVVDMAPFYQAADCVLSKAGGLTVSEALACGLPLILIDVIPGQETGNAAYVVSGNAGVHAQDPIEVLETTCHWLEKDRLLYQQQAVNARQLGCPNAGYDVAECIWSLA